MTWTSTRPTEPGFYFYHPKDSDPNDIMVAQVIMMPEKGSGMYCTFTAFSYGFRPIHSWPIADFDGMWSGPIESPGPYHG